MNKPSILVLDDLQEYRWMFKALLEQEYNVFTAATGDEAVALTERYQFQLIVTDLNMVPMDGLTFVERIKANPKTAHIPVIVATAGEFPRSELDVAAYLSKAELTKALHATVRSILRDRGDIR